MELKADKMVEMGISVSAVEVLIYENSNSNNMAVLAMIGAGITGNAIPITYVSREIPTHSRRIPTFQGSG